MKRIIILILIFSSSTLFHSCKKKKADAPVATQSTTNTGGVFTAKVNGSSWSMISDQNGMGYFMSNYGSLHEFGGITSFSPPYSLIALHFLCNTGTYTLGSAGPFSAIYGTSGGSTYTSKSGTINITYIDTVSDSQFLKKLKCTFSFVTDTIAGKSFNITEGNVDFTKP